ncbi:MAG: RlmE family RNA methyltransferase [Pseudomonadota bacterium]
MSGPRRSSRGWRERQERDPWVKKSREEGYRSRAVYKLSELLEGLNVLRRGMVAVDLGAAPGGWSQWLARRLDGKAAVYALDLLDMDPLPGVTFIQGDFTEQESLETLEAHLGGRKADLVMSDMAPNMSGVRAVDQPRAMYLAELALDFAGQHLTPQGTFVCKVFQGAGFDAYARDLRQRFGNVKIKKPKASRSSSTEMYVLARNYRFV